MGTYLSWYIIANALIELASGKNRPTLFDGNRLGQVAGLVDVASAAHGDVISEQLQRDYIKNRQQQLGRGWDVEDMIDELFDVLVTLDRDGDDFT